MPEENKAPAAAAPKKDPKNVQFSVNEYKALQAKEAKKFKLTIPLPVKIILSLPLIAIALFGLFYIPFTAYQNATSSENPPDTGKIAKKKVIVNK